MELVYLWVEDYKNIKNQGFNFSPRFECKYDEKSKKLTIDEKKDYISIFPENINITAIVGENGSGKSTIVEFLLQLFSTKFESELTYNFVLLYLYENKPRYYSYKVNPLNISQLRINSLRIDEQLDLLLNTYNKADGHENLISLYINNEYSKIDSRESEQFFMENSKKSLREINSMIIKNSLTLKDVLIKIENYFIPTKINISLQEVDYFTSILDKDREFYKDDVWDKIIALKSQLKDTTLSSKIDLIKKIFEIKREEFDTVMGESFFSLFKVKDKNYFNWEYQDFGSDIPIKILENLTTGNVHTLNISDIDDEILSFLYELPKEFDIELEDEKRKFSQLSFGERQLLILMNNILKYFLLDKYSTYHHDQDGEEYKEVHDIDKIMIFIDEFELGLHPNWQKRFLSYFNEISQLTNKKIHLIVTSHSPFLLSDLPKENIVFLEKGKQVYPFKGTEQTFGANIHTLLSHGFFMTDGLMGEFAKNKIRTIQITYKYILHRNKQKSLNKKEHKKSRRFIKTQLKILWHIQSIIGEKFLQTITKNYLQEIEEILFGNEKAIDNEIERLQNLKQSIKNAKS